MFGNKRNYNDIFRAFDEMFSQFDLTQNEWKSKSRVSDDGTIKVTTYYRGDSSKSEEGIDRLKYQLNMAIENEDFETAVKLFLHLHTNALNRSQIKTFELSARLNLITEFF